MNIFVLFFISIFVFFNINAKKPTPDPVVPGKKNLVVPFSTAEQFSGAFLWAHKKNITGKDQVITVIEQEDVSDVLKHKIGEDLISDPGLQKKKTEIDHASTVVSAFRKIAPESKISLIKLDVLLKEEDQLNKWVANSFLINFSQGFTSRFLKNTVEDRGPSAYDQFKEKQVKDINRIKSLMQKGTNKILFIAAGNENISISEPIGKWKEEEFYLIPKEALLDPFLADFTIIVGGIDQFFRNSSTSNFPGLSEMVQNNFILTLGKNIKLLNHGKESLQNGTSFASPIAAGAAALLKQKYPDFSAHQIKEVILESASRSFFIEKDSSIPGATNIFVYDPADPLTQSISSNAQVQVKPFDPSLYGKGILNLQAAFVYGDLKAKHPTWDKKKLRMEMQTILSQQLNDAAVTLQKAFKKYQAQKKLKPIKRPKSNGKNRK